MQDNDELNTILMKRAAPPPTPSGLSERIIHAAVSQIQSKPRVATFWDEIMGMIVVPHPSVAVAAGIIVGLVAGLQASDGLSMLQQDWSSFMVINEGGWL